MSRSIIYFSEVNVWIQNDENRNDISHDLEILKQKLNSQENTPVFYKKKALSKEDAIFFAGLIDLMIQRLQSSNNN